MGADGRDQNMRESFVVPVNAQRREMAGNVILYVSPSLHDFLIPSFLLSTIKSTQMASSYREGT